MLVFYKISAILFIILVFFSVICYVVLFQHFIEEEHNFKLKQNYEIIPVHWFNLMSAEYSRIRNCHNAVCHFTGGDDPFKLQNAKAVLFYGSDMDNELPLPRPPKQIWALLHEESPKNIRYLSNSKFIQHFNLTSTMSRYSDNPLTLLYLPSLEALIDNTHYKSIAEKSNLAHASVLFIQTDCSTPTRREDYVSELMEFIHIDSYGSCLNNKQQPESFAELTDISYYKSHEQKSKNSPVLFLQSNCGTLSRREEYVRELMQYIEIDSYGSCLNNRNQSPSLQNDYLNKLYTAEPLHLMSEYKFVLSIENAVCEDYITEKFWRPLIAGSIPLYFGSPSIRDWAPNDKSVIYIDDFENAKALAAFLQQLSNNDTEYSTYMKHKLDKNQPISNQRLIKELSTRPYKEVFQVFSAFECHVCIALNENFQGLRPANIDHYNCPLPPRQLPTISDDIVHSNQIKSLQQEAECMAKVMDDLLVKNSKFSLNYSNSLIQLLCNKEQYDFNKSF